MAPVHSKMGKENRGAYYVGYSEEDVESAIRAVRDDKEKIATAARRYNVPRKTLSDRLTGRHAKKNGKPTTLTDEEEVALVNYLDYMHAHHFPLSIVHVKAFAWQIARRSGRKIQFLQSGPSEKWWRGFKGRHPDIAMRVSDTLDRGRHRMSNRTVYARYFAKLHSVLEENELMNKPENLFNCDESGINMELRQGKVVVKRGSKHVHAVSKGSRDHITVHCCVDAAGGFLPPMIVYEKSFPSQPYKAEGIPGTLYAKSPNGYMDGELFYKWFSELFVPRTNHLGKRILFLDGHESHINLKMIDHAIENNVILFCLPPHTTHDLQPLDVAVFKPLKNHFSKLTDHIIIVSATTGNLKFNVCKTNFHVIFKVAFDRTMSAETIKAGFRRTGISPFDPEVILHRYPPAPISASASTTTTTTVSAISTTMATTTTLATVVSPAAPDPISGTIPITPSPSLSYHPLVAVGLIPRELSDTLLTPPTQYIEKKQSSSRVIVTERVLTEPAWREKIAGKENEKIEKEEKKEVRRAAREAKKIVNEAKKVAKEANKVAKETKKRTATRSRSPVARQLVVPTVYDSPVQSFASVTPFSPLNPMPDDSPLIPLLDDDSPVKVKFPFPSTRSGRAVKANKRYVESEPSESESEGNSSWSEESVDESDICGICNRETPKGIRMKFFQWIQCDGCFSWYHQICEVKRRGSPIVTSGVEYTCAACESE